MNAPRSLRQWLKPLGLLVGGSLILGALIQSILAAGPFLPGFLAASLLIFLCGTALYLAWVATGRGKPFAWMILTAFLLRLALGVFLAWGLPRYGYEEAPQQAGFVFADAYHRDGSAWHLAQSDAPLMTAFSDAYPADQYGGFLALSALVYRILSPDAYRPYLISIISAGAMALSVPFLIAVVRRKFDLKTALWAGWILALMPEGILLGSSQMREPFFILFFTILFWAAAHWLDRTRLSLALPAFLLSALSLLLLSFRVAVPLIGVVLLWVWVIESLNLEKIWIKWVGWAVIGLGLAAAVGVSREWITAVLRWDSLQTVLRSGRVQFQLESLPEWLHFPFILVYGLFQPVLPAAVAAPAPWIWRSLGIFRALGWYLLMPLLVYAFVRVWRVESRKRRSGLVVIVLAVIAWILIASARGGGDQWDNPRYRMIFLPWMALVAGWGLQVAVETRDRWLGRSLLIEGIFLAFFTAWYVSRYYPVIPRFDFWVMIGIILALSLMVLIGGWLRDRKRAQDALTTDGDSL